MVTEERTQAPATPQPELTPATEVSEPAVQVLRHKTAVSLRVRAIGPEGFELEIGVDNVTWVSLETTAVQAKAFEKAIAAAGFEPLVYNAAPGVSEPAQASQGAAGGQDKGKAPTECPDCGGEIYDNRQKKADEPSWRGPLFKCRDDDCGWAKWAPKKR